MFLVMGNFNNTKHSHKFWGSHKILEVCRFLRHIWIRLPFCYYLWSKYSHLQKWSSILKLISWMYSNEYINRIIFAFALQLVTFFNLKFVSNKRNTKKIPKMLKLFQRLKNVYFILLHSFFLFLFEKYPKFKNSSYEKKKLYPFQLKSSTY